MDEGRQQQQRMNAGVVATATTARINQPDTFSHNELIRSNEYFAEY
jgi:hypothetical protein